MADRQDGKQIARLQALLNVLEPELRGRDVLIAALADHYPPDASSARRAFERDIVALRRLGFDIVKQPGAPPRYTLRGHRYTFAWSETDIHSLAILRESIPNTLPYGAAIQALLTRLTDDLKPEERRIYEQHPVIRLLAPPALDYAPYAVLIAQLQTAIDSSRMIHFAYQSTTSPSVTRHSKVEPYEIVYYERHFYLGAYTFSTGFEYDFRIDRIRPEIDFGFLPNQAQPRQRRLITFRYRASASLARDGISQRFEQQRVVERYPDGSALIEAQGRSAFFIIQALARYRDQAELIEPDWLRERMHVEVRRMLALYEGADIRP